MNKNTGKFRKFILNEIDFYIEYFEDHGMVYKTLSDFNKISTCRINDENLLYNHTPGDEESNELKFARLNGSGRWDFNFEDADNEKYAKDKDLKEKAECDRYSMFQPIVKLLKANRHKFIEDVIHLNKLAHFEGDDFEQDGDFVLRLALWSSVFANDKDGSLSPLGPFSHGVTAAMRNHEIGILDALSQQLWHYSWSDKEQKEKQNENIWRTDLIRSQLLILVVYHSFKTFLTKENKDYQLLNDMLEVWIRRKRKVDYSEHTRKLKTLINNNGPTDCSETNLENLRLKENLYLPLSNYLKSNWNQLSNNSNDKNENTDIDKDEKNKKIEIINAFIRVLDVKPFKLWNENRADKAINDEVNKILSDDKKFIRRTEWYKNFINSLYQLTYFKADIKEPPLVQLINDSASSWAADREVPTIIVINRRDAQSDDMVTRLQSYAALPHEAGHDISDSFKDDELIYSLKKAIRNHDFIKEKNIWYSWINEIFADATGVALLGAASILGLIKALDDLHYPNNIIAANDNETDYESHPVPPIRIYLVKEFAIAYLHGQHSSELDAIIVEAYKAKYESLKIETFHDKLCHKKVRHADLKQDAIHIVNIFINYKLPCLMNRTVKDLFDALKSDRYFNILSKNFKDLLDPELMNLQKKRTKIDCTKKPIEE